MKKQLQVIASGINNLTDARYFSAMGVDWMTFDLRTEPRIALEQMHAIMDWVEGPGWLVEIPAELTGIPEGVQGCIAPRNVESLNSYDQVIVQSSGVGLIDSGQHTLIDFEGKPEADVAATLRDIVHDAQLWIKATWTAGLVEVAIVNPSISGLVVTAGTEDEIGVKDYGAIDALFDSLDALAE